MFSMHYSHMLCAALVVVLALHSVTSQEVNVEFDTFLKASTPKKGQSFGASVSISGDILVVGVPWDDSPATGVNGSDINAPANKSGAAYVFVRSGALWIQQAYIKASNTGIDDQFGWSVAVYGDTVVIGAPYEDSSGTGVNPNMEGDGANDSGAVYVFVRNAGGVTIPWIQQAYVKASNTGNDDQFGCSVAIYEDIIVVGALREDSSATGVNGAQENGATDSGAAYVFVRDGEVWTQIAYLKSSVTGAHYLFGFSVAVWRTSGTDYIIVGSPNETVESFAASNPGAGAAYVFKRDSVGLSGWILHSRITSPSPNTLDAFGYSVGIHGTTIAVGAPLADGPAGFQDSGVVHYMSLIDGGSLQPLIGGGSDALGYFGWSLAVSEDYILVGAANEYSGVLFTGVAYLFGTPDPDSPVFSQVSQIKVDHLGVADRFGAAVALQNVFVVIGAPLDDACARVDENCTDSGAVYVFTIPGVGTSSEDISTITSETPRTSSSNILVTSETSTSGLSSKILFSLIGIICFLLVLGVVFAVLFLWWRRRLASDHNSGPTVELNALSKSSTGRDTTYSPLDPITPHPQASFTTDIPMETGNLPNGQNKVIDYTELKNMTVIGEGAYGVVSKATYRKQEVAVKMLKGDALTEEQLTEFKKEISIIKAIPYHRNVVALCGICEKPLCIVTDFMHGGSVLELLQKKEQLSIGRIITMVNDVISALIHLHAERVVHRDLACRNLLLSKNGEVKISDFGMSRSFDVSNNVTKSDTGPLRWMAPECLQQRNYSPASDVWAFGCVLIELLTNQPPYPTMSANDAAAGVVFRGMTPDVPQRCPPALSAIIKSCFQSDPSRRPTAEMIAQKLEDMPPH